MARFQLQVNGCPIPWKRIPRLPLLISEFA